VDSRLRRSPPDRASAVPYGQAGENAMRFPHLAHRSAAAHKLHSTPQQDRMNLISGKGETSSRLPVFSLFLPGSCPINRDRRTTSFPPATDFTAERDLRARAGVAWEPLTTSTGVSAGRDVTAGSTTAFGLRPSPRAFANVERRSE
jgi:acetyl esterase/lipase